MFAMTGKQRQHLVQKQHGRTALGRCRKDAMGLEAKPEERRKGRSQGGWEPPGEGLCSSTACLAPVLRGRLQVHLLSRGHPECPPCVLPLG